MDSSKESLREDSFTQQMHEVIYEEGRGTEESKELAEILASEIGMDEREMPPLSRIATGLYICPGVGDNENLSFKRLIGNYLAVKFPAVSLKQQKCCFYRKTDDDPTQAQETIWRFVSFANVPLNLRNKFHRSLLDSCLRRLKIRDLESIDLFEPVPRFTSYGNSVETLIKALSSQAAALTLLLIVFLDNYYPAKLAAIYNQFNLPGLLHPFFRSLNKLTQEITKLFLKKKIEALIENQDHFLEACFFIYAGVVLQCFTDTPRSTKQILRAIKKSPRTALVYAAQLLN